MRLTGLVGVDSSRTAPPLSPTVRREGAASRVDCVTREIPSITRLGVVRFVPDEDKRPGGVVELPSFRSDDTSRPTVQMPPLADRRAPPGSIDEAFDTGQADEPGPEGAPRKQSSTLVGVVPSPVPPRPPLSAPSPIGPEPTLPIGSVIRTPAPRDRPTGEL
jgi:hypothetical protein